MTRELIPRFSATVDRVNLGPVDVRSLEHPDNLLKRTVGLVYVRSYECSVSWKGLLSHKETVLLYKVLITRKPTLASPLFLYVIPNSL